MTTGSLNWFKQQSGSGGGCSSRANISCIGIGRGWQFPIPTADEEGQNLQLHRTCCPMEGGVAALWCKKFVPSHIIQSKRGQGGGRRHNGLNLNCMNDNMEQPQALRNIPDEAPPSSHHPAAPAWLEVKGFDDKGRRGNIKRHSNDDKRQQQPIREEVIERKTTTLAVSLSSSDEEDSEHPNDDDEMTQNESYIEKAEDIVFPSSKFCYVNTKEDDGAPSSDSEERQLASNNSCGKAERCLWNNREDEGFNNAAAAIKEQKSPPPFNNKNKLRRLVKTRDKEDECGGSDDDNNKREAALNAMRQQQLELPENSTTPKWKRLMKTTTTENANIQEVIKSYEKEDADELWSDNDEYESESESIEYEYDDVLAVNCADIQAGGGENNAIASSSSKDEIAATSQLSSTSYWCNDSHSEEYFQRSSKRASVIVDLTSDGDEESDGTKHHLTPSQQSGDRSKYPVNDIVGPSQAESIADFSEDGDHLKQVSGYRGRYGTYPNFKTVRQLYNSGGSNVDFNLMLKYQNGKVRTDSYEVRQRKRIAKKQQKKGKKPPRKSNAKVGKSRKRYSSAVPSRGLHNEGRGAVKRAHQWAPPDI